MINRLRAQLIILFVSLVMLIYVVDSVVAFYLFEHRQNASIKLNAVRLRDEIVPAVSIENGLPTLKKWYALSLQRHVHTLESVQLFDAHGRLLEQYGLSGIPRLFDGRLSAHPAEKMTFYSSNVPLLGVGYVQIQVPVESYEEIVLSFTLTKLARFVVIGLVVGICGWYYSGKAIAPVTSAINTLRTFVHDAGHELNTPVTLIEQSIETLEADLKDRGVSTDVLHIIEHASHRLKSLAGDLLFLAKMEQPEIVFRKAPINPCDVVAMVADDLKGRASSRQIALEVGQLPEATVYGDKDALARVFTNLIENAIRYTPEQGKIMIRGAQQEGKIAIGISDTGIGIPESNLPYIFDRFYRVDKARSRAEGGAGLGLSIVKAIVEAHGGSIKVDSRTGKGSDFTVVLPVTD